MEDYPYRNSGKQVEAYLRSVNFAPGYAWCAAFVNWNYEQCGKPDRMPASAWAPTYARPDKIIYQGGYVPKRMPLNGDLMFIFDRSAGRICHIGFIDQWVDPYGYVLTVEGNTTDNNGGLEANGVYRKRRLQRQIYQVANWLDKL